MPKDILKLHCDTLAALEAQLEAIPDHRWHWRPAPEVWSAAEVYDHIGKIALLYSFPKLEACLQGKGESARRRSFMGWCLMTGPWLAGVFRHRREFPPELVPQGITKAQARAMLAELHQRAEQVAPKVKAAGRSLRVEHVRLGWLHARDWFAFAEIHSRHHLKGQLQRLMALPSPEHEEDILKQAH